MNKPKFFSIVIISSFLFPLPAFAYDNEGPIVTTFTISPALVDVTDSDANVTVTFGATDATGVQYAILVCFSEREPRPLQVTLLSQREPWQPEVLGHYNGNLPIGSSTGNRQSFQVEFVAQIRVGSWPGPVACSVSILDTLENESQYDNLAPFNIIRAGVGYPSDSPASETNEEEDYFQDESYFEEENDSEALLGYGDPRVSRTGIPPRSQSNDTNSTPRPNGTSGTSPDILQNSGSGQDPSRANEEVSGLTLAGNQSDDFGGPNSTLLVALTSLITVALTLSAQEAWRRFRPLSKKVK